MDIDSRLARIDDQLMELGSAFSALSMLMERGFAVQHVHNPQPFIDMVDRLIDATRQSPRGSEPMPTEELLEAAARTATHLQRFLDRALERMRDV